MKGKVRVSCYREFTTDIFTPAKSDIAIHPYYTSGGAKQRIKCISGDDRDNADERKSRIYFTQETKTGKASKRLINWRGLIHNKVDRHSYIETANKKYHKYLLRWCNFDKPEAVKNEIDNIFSTVKDIAQDTATDKQFEVLGRRFYGESLESIGNGLGISKQSVSERFDLIKKKLKHELPKTLKRVDKALMKKKEHIWSIAKAESRLTEAAKRFLENNPYLQKYLK